MSKEKLTLDAIKKDLCRYAEWQLYKKGSPSLGLFVAFLALAVVLGIYLQNVWISMIVLLPAAFFLYKFITECKEHNDQKKTIMSMIDRGEISISVERLSSIHEDYQAKHSAFRDSVKFDAIKKYYFQSSIEWRDPLFDKNYEWSADNYISSTGLGNISLYDDEFYYVCLQDYRDIAYIYPCKIFELDKSLE